MPEDYIVRNIGQFPTITAEGVADTDSLPIWDPSAEGADRTKKISVAEARYLFSFNSVPLTQLGAPNGVATLDSSGLIPAAQSRPCSVDFDVDTLAFTWADGSTQDAVLSGFAASGHGHSNASGSVAGFMSSADFTKLAGIATGATANSTDAQLRDRSTHTGEQPTSTITGLDTALAGFAASGHGHSNASGSVAGFMSSADFTKLAGIATGATANSTDAQLRDRSTHTGEQPTSTITGLDTALAGFAASGHGHSNASGSVAGFMSSADFTKLAGIATGATANSTDAQLRDRSTHTGEQPTSTITGLDTALAGFAASGHGHSNASGSVAGFMSSADFTKLAGIATGATANSTDAQLRDRSTHTGTQPNTTITGLGTLSTQNANSIAVTGGAIDGTPIGATTAAAVRGITGVFTSSTAATSSATGALVVGGGVGIGGAIFNPGLSIAATGEIQSVGVGRGSVVGNARGAGAIDLQTSRDSAVHVASGANSVICGGASNRTTGGFAIVCGGISNSANGGNSFVGGGDSNSTGNFASVSGGYQNSAGGDFSAIPGGQRASAWRYGQQAFSAGRFSSTGDAQAAILMARNITTNATATTLFLDGSGVRILLNNNSSLAYDICISAHSTTNVAEQATFWRRGKIYRVANAASTTLVPGEIAENQTNGLPWTVTVSADTSNGALNIAVTGEASKTIRWVARINAVEVLS